jgi:sigma-B regulation protein RsbU (phosphoserine phosphatase)
MSNPRFQWKAPDGKEQVFTITAPEVVIGRKTDADISISNQHVSRHHAKVVAIAAGGHQLVDLGSTYGTFVNGQRIESRVLSHGDRVTFGRDELEFHYLTEAAASTRSEADTTRIVQKSFKDLGRVLPSEASDLEKILVILDFQHQWSQVFTPENGLEQILEHALKISGAERAFIMTRKADMFGYAAGMDGKGHKLSESNFQTSRSIVRDAVSHGRPVFMVEGIDRDFAEQESIVAMNLRAIACLPLRGIPTEGDSPEILGILYLDSTKAMHSLSGLDQKILNKLAVEAGNVLERVEMIKSIEQRKTLERDLALAEDTQRAILREIPKVDYLRLDAFSKPTRYVGGDFYHCQVMESGETIGVLADISGKGIAASLMSSMLLGCLQLLLSGGDAPAAALNRLNKFLHEKSSGRFATMFLFSANPNGTGQFISAGHNPAYLYRAAQKEIEELHSNCMILGAFDFAVFQSSPLELHKADVLLVYSDGLTEAEDPSGAMFGEERVKEIMCREAPLGANQVRKALLAAIEQFTRGRTQTDDITIMIAERV